MGKYLLSNVAKDDLIRIHHYGVAKFGLIQANKYFVTFFGLLWNYSSTTISFESIDYIKTGYRQCIWGSDTIYFRVNNDIFEIMAIVGRQNLNNIFDE